MAGPSPVYHSGNTAEAPDGRLFGPVFERNAPPLIAALTPLLADVTGTVLEIGSGTGQHASAFQLAFPHLTWQPSDRETPHRTSIAAWRAHLGLPPLPALNIDALNDWADSLRPVDAVFSMNVVHIAPFTVAEGIFRGAGKLLRPGGQLMLYGPFKQGDNWFGDGNQSFDARLRNQDPSWGIRDMAEMNNLAQSVDLEPLQPRPMPSNNHLLVFRNN